jgi:dihydroorotate dehydrogenase
MLDLYRLARPALFSIDPEAAHDLTLASIDAMAASGMLRVAAGPPVVAPVELMGLRFRNRVGLAAGLDKNGAHITALTQLGFGFVEVGTVTPKPQPGNPKPRMFRLPKANALINRMGFNNDGLERFVRNVQHAGGDGIIGLNIGKNAATPIGDALQDYRIGLTGVYPHASYVVINISSPNTANLRQLQQADELRLMLTALKQEQTRLAKKHRRYVPLAVKIAPDLDDAQIQAIAQQLISCGVDAVIATNTTIERAAVAGLRHAEQAGGLSGAPVLQASNRVIRSLRELLPSRFPIIGVGGIMSGEDAASKIAAGADLVQIYTGLIYRGPALVRECALAIQGSSTSSA